MDNCSQPAPPPSKATLGRFPLRARILRQRGCSGVWDCSACLALGSSGVAAKERKALRCDLLDT